MSARGGRVPAVLFGGLAGVGLIFTLWFALEAVLLWTGQAPITFYVRNELSWYPRETAFAVAVLAFALGAAITHFVFDADPKGAAMRLPKLVETTIEDLEARLVHRRVHPHPHPAPAPVTPSCPVAHVAFVNRSTVVTDDEVRAAVVDLQTQVCLDFAPAWLIEAELHVAASPALGDWVVYIEDDATVPGALGYHEIVDGRPTAHVFARTTQQLAVKARAAGNHPPTWSSVASHELLEMLGDPRTVLAAVIDPNGDGRSGRIVMAEACDAVEQSVYVVGATEVSNFVTPAWFDSAATTGPFDRLGQIHGPLELLPGGSYIGFIDFTSAQGWQQQTAEHAPST